MTIAELRAEARRGEILSAGGVVLEFGLAASFAYDGDVTMTLIALAGGWYSIFTFFRFRRVRRRLDRILQKANLGRGDTRNDTQ